VVIVLIVAESSGGPSFSLGDIVGFYIALGIMLAVWITWLVISHRDGRR
jgi:hypothetical protein